ncbi:F0F1 ATP synthase subunit B family protein [Rhodovibrionaceae bacterium A322]
MRFSLPTVAVSLLVGTGTAFAEEVGGLPQIKQVDTFASQIFWLVVTFATLYFIMSRMVLPRVTEVMEERRHKIDDDLARAERLKTEATDVMADYETALTDAREQASDSLKKTSDELTAKATARHDAFTQELAEKSREADERIASATAEAMDNLKTVAAEAAVAVTQKLVGVKPTKAKVEKAVNEAVGG